MLPAGEHVGEGERLQTGVDQIRFRRLLLVLFCGNKSNNGSSALKEHPIGFLMSAVIAVVFFALHFNLPEWLVLLSEDVVNLPSTASERNG